VEGIPAGACSRHDAGIQTRSLIPSCGDYGELLARNRAGHAMIPLRLAKRVNHEDTKDTKEITKLFDLELIDEYFYSLRESFVLLAPSWLNRVSPHSDPWSGSKH
jgi:hypothetical protein